jgi:uncharacterized iron-regulated membrane protein
VAVLVAVLVVGVLGVAMAARGVSRWWHREHEPALDERQAALNCRPLANVTVLRGEDPP